MTLSAAEFLIDQPPRPAAVLLQILPALLLPAGRSSLAVSAGVSSLAGTFVIPAAPPCTVTGPLSPTLVGLTSRTSSCSSSCFSDLLPSSPSLLLAPPGWPVPDERVLVATGPARVALVAAGQYPPLSISALQEVNLLLVDEHLEDAACTKGSLNCYRNIKRRLTFQTG